MIAGEFLRTPFESCSWLFADEDGNVVCTRTWALQLGPIGSMARRLAVDAPDTKRNPHRQT